MSEYIACPFCGEDDFDQVGLKGHLTAGDCGVFDEINAPTRLFHGRGASDYDATAAHLARVTTERDALAKRINHDGTPVDIAALCVEIDEVTDELARVKAESLRVVRMTEDRSPVNIDTMVQHIHIDGHIVRLERWEAQP